MLDLKRVYATQTQIWDIPTFKVTSIFSRENILIQFLSESIESPTFCLYPPVKFLNMI